MRKWPIALVFMLFALSSLAAKTARYERVGGDVKPPKILHAVYPKYPEAARKARVTGIVIVEAKINEKGGVDGVTVQKGLGHGLDEAATDAVRQFTFAPATKAGKPVAVIFEVPVSFRLSD